MPDGVKKMLLSLYFLARLPIIMFLKVALRPHSKGMGMKRILIIRLDRLGDLVMSLPFINDLSEAYPAAKIDIMVKPYLAELAGEIQQINDVIVYRGFMDALRRLPNRRYDIAIDMLHDYTLAPAVAAILSGSPIRVGFRGGFREMLFTDPVDGSPGPGRGIVEVNAALLKPLGAPFNTKIPRLDIGGGGRKVSLKPFTIGIHPGGYYESQRWPADRFALLAKMLSERYRSRIVVIGGPQDRKDVEKIANAITGQNIVPVFPSMRELVKVISDCSLLICNNSGPLHLACALGVPTVSMMGPSDPDLWWPKGEYQTVIRKAVECSPCSRGKCVGHECMETITAEEVFREAEELIKRTYGP